MQQWMQDHSALLALLIPTIINLLSDIWVKWLGSPNEHELEQRSQFWGGIAHIFRGGGIDVVRVLQGLGQVLLSLASKSKTIGPPVILVLGCGAMVFGGSSCASWTRQDTKNAVELVRAIAEEVCSPGNPTLDACVDRLLADPRVAGAREHGIHADARPPSTRPETAPRD